jgi:hypothetical protein
MARFFGLVGYGHTVENPSGSGVYTETITEKPYYGEVFVNTRRIDASQKVNFDISLTNSISIVADAYANENFFAIRYAAWNGALWVVTSVQVQRPRLILELGGVYNGPTPGSP